MRVSGLKGASSRVILAVLYTSILWFTLDVMVLTMYTALNEEGSGSTLKLPTNTEHLRNARDGGGGGGGRGGGDFGDPVKDAKDGRNAISDELWRDFLKSRAKANRTLRAQEPHARRSRFSWGNDLKDKLMASNGSSDALQIKGEEDEQGDRISEVRADIKKEIDMLKKELASIRDKGDQDGSAKRDFSHIEEKIANLYNSPENAISGREEKRERSSNVLLGNPNEDRYAAVMGFNISNKKSSPTPGSHRIRDIDVTSMPHDPHGPGERGAVVRTKPSDEPKVKIGWEHAYFNEFVSDMISVERSVPDVRPPGCKDKLYSNGLPRTSVIICFTEESWSTLLRTVHSVLNRSPPELLSEVILVDDFSQRDYLKTPLDEYMAKLPKVKIIRLKQREGLIRARLIGAENAQGPVLTFLDSHVECNVGWLEPLLQRIHDNPSNVVCPSIDSIDAYTFQYTGSGEGIIGAFNWEMKFVWNPMPDYEKKRRTDVTSPIRSPAMAGGLFSIDKAFFYHLGTYDPGFDIWGAENLELSFKIWMCGGALEIVPCSRVAHIFRKQQPYKFPGGNMNTYLRNTMRLVEVWVDEPYRDIFYSLKPQLIGQKFGDVSDRVTLREHLQCNSFKWFLENVFPALQVPNTQVRARGEVKNLGNNMCLDTMGKGILGMFPCHGEGNNQAFGLSWEDILQHKSQCLGLIKGMTQLVMQKCGKAENVHLKHTRGHTIQEMTTGKCLDFSADRTMAVLKHCDGSSNQRWKFAYYYDRKGRLLP